MLKISIFELFVALIPETILFVLGAYVLNNKAFEWKKIILIGSITGLTAYLIRLLPIIPGVNIIFVMIMIPAGLVIMSHFEVIKAISSVLVLLIIRLASEWFNIILLLKVLNLDIDKISSNPVTKTITFLPSVLLFALVIYTICRFKYRNRK